MKGADFNKEEKKMAKRDHATVVKNSGRGERKGDARTDDFLIDYKFTSKDSFALNLEKFTKHEKDAWKEQRFPVIVTVFTERGNKSIAMLEWDTLKDMLQEMQEEIDYLRDVVHDYLGG